MNEFTVLLIAGVFCTVWTGCNALMCYKCGKYTPEGTGSVLPCYEYNRSNLLDCFSHQHYCLKYVNSGIIIRDCVQDCQPKTDAVTAFFCCQEDGCNGANALTRSYTITVVSRALAFTGFALINSSL